MQQMRIPARRIFTNLNLADEGNVRNGALPTSESLLERSYRQVFFVGNEDPIEEEEPIQSFQDRT